MKLSLYNIVIMGIISLLMIPAHARSKKRDAASKAKGVTIYIYNKEGFPITASIYEPIDPTLPWEEEFGSDFEGQTEIDQGTMGMLKRSLNHPDTHALDIYPVGASRMQPLGQVKFQVVTGKETFHVEVANGKVRLLNGSPEQEEAAYEADMKKAKAEHRKVALKEAGLRTGKKTKGSKTTRMRPEKAVKQPAQGRRAQAAY